MSHEDCAGLSDDELEDILARMDRERFPERYKEVRNEYARRHPSLGSAASLDEHFEREAMRRPFIEKLSLHVGCILLLVAIALVSLIIRLVIYLGSLV